MTTTIAVNSHTPGLIRLRASFSLGVLLPCAAGTLTACALGDETRAEGETSTRQQDLAGDVTEQRRSQMTDVEQQQQVANNDAELVDGQSGSEDHDGEGAAVGGETVPCPCAPANAALRVELLGRSGSEVTLLVEEVIALGPYADTLVVSEGDVLTAMSDGLLPCYRGEESVEVGSEALAVYGQVVRESTCAEAEQCLQKAQSDPSAECASDEDISIAADCCARLCGDAGTERVEVSVRLSPWAEQITFAQTDAESLVVPADDLARLWEMPVLECVAQYGDWASLKGAFTGAAP